MKTKGPKQFAEFLMDMEPHVHDMAVISDIRPSDSLIGYPVQSPEDKAAWNYFDLLLPRCILHPEPDAKPTEFAPYEGQHNTFDRFRSVFPNVTEAWKRGSVRP